MALVRRTVVAPASAVCFGCNQSFEGNPVGYAFETDLLPPAQAAELRGLLFHHGHLAHYAHRRGWTELATAAAHEGPGGL